MEPDGIAAALEAAQEAAAKVLADRFEAEDVEIASMAMHVAVRPVEERRQPDGWHVFVFSWMTQPEVLDALPDGEEVRNALSQVMRHNSAQLAVPPPPPRPRKPQAPI